MVALVATFTPRGLEQEAERLERGETLLSSRSATIDYLRVLWLALAYDDGSLRAEVVPLARAYESATTATARARAGEAIADWARLRELGICRAFGTPFRG